VTTSGRPAHVVESYGRRVVVADENGDEYSCKLKRRDLDLVAGDDVMIVRATGDDEWTVVERRPRRNIFSRSDSRGRTESLAANLDQLVAVVARRPACDPYIVDRYVAGARQAGIPALLVVNKRDLPADEGNLSFVPPLRAIELPVLEVSARTGEGLESLVARLTGRRSLFAGQSGVGKSSLLNALVGQPQRATGSLSLATGEGRHTTVSSAILRAPWGEVVDSPGVRDYAPPVVPTAEVQLGFAEIAARAGGCRFLDCLHLREPQCAVRAALESGEIDDRRYDSYRRLMNLNRQLDERRGWSR
jgi:ribosome biogenesis GTPase / thiamine phosphate phosphatase